MKKIFDYISLVAVILLMHGAVQNFELKADYLHGPLNPYAFFTDDVRSSLERASDKVIKGDFSAYAGMAFQSVRLLVDMGCIAFLLFNLAFHFFLAHDVKGFRFVDQNGNSKVLVRDLGSEQE